MATKVQSKVQDTAIEEQAPNVEAIKESIAQHQAAAKALRDSLKALKHSGSPLEKVEARQQKHNGRLALQLGKMLRNRVSVGQSREDAVEAVTSICHSILVNMPETAEAGDDDEADDE